MRNTLRAFVSGVCLAVVSATSGAQQLPNSGNITVHSGWKSIGETTQAAEGRTYGFGSFWGRLLRANPQRATGTTQVADNRAGPLLATVAGQRMMTMSGDSLW